MPRGKFIPNKNRLHSVSAALPTSQAPPARMTLIKSEAPAKKRFEVQDTIQPSQAQPATNLEKPGLNTMLTSVLVALFIVINIGLALFMKSDNSSAPHETEARKHRMSAPAHPPLAAHSPEAVVTATTPVEIAATPVVSQAPSIAVRAVRPTTPRREPPFTAIDLLSIIRKE